MLIAGIPRVSAITLLRVLIGRPVCKLCSVIIINHELSLVRIAQLVIILAFMLFYRYLVF